MFDRALDMVPFFDLNSEIKSQRVEQFWTQMKDIQLDQARTNQFSQNSWLWGIPVNEIIFSI